MNLKTKNILIRICYIIPFLIFAYTFIDEGFLVDERFRKVDFWIVSPMILDFFLFMIGKGVFSSIDDLGSKIDIQEFIVQCVM